MRDPTSDDAEAARIFAKVRRLMLAVSLGTFVAIGIVLAIIGYRVSRSEGSAAPADVTAALPKGARVIATAVSEDRLLVTIEAGGRVEIHTFDVRTLKPAGRLRFTSEP